MKKAKFKPEFKLPKWSDCKANDKSDGRRLFRIGNVTFSVERNIVKGPTKRRYYDTEIYYGENWIIEIYGPNGDIDWPGITDKKFKTRRDAQRVVESLLRHILIIAADLVSVHTSTSIEVTWPYHEVIR